MFCRKSVLRRCILACGLGLVRGCQSELRVENFCLAIWRSKERPRVPDLERVQCCLLEDGPNPEWLRPISIDSLQLRSEHLPVS